MHDIHIDTVTNVAERFPERVRDDGRFYAIDLTLAEIKTLSVHERVDHETGQPVFPGRFPLGKSSFKIPTLAEELELIQGLNASTGREVGIYPEIKKPAWHRDQGQDISVIVLRELADQGYRRKSDRIYLQCFDPVELSRIRHELKCELRLVQLVGENSWDEAKTDYDVMRSPAGLQRIAAYADGIGPWIPHIVLDVAAGEPRLSRLVQEAHEHRLVVHPYTFRQDSLPEGIRDARQLMQLLQKARVDGVFTDFPDITRRLIEEL